MNDNDVLRQMLRRPDYDNNARLQKAAERLGRKVWREDTESKKERKTRTSKKVRVTVDGLVILEDYTAEVAKKAGYNISTVRDYASKGKKDRYGRKYRYVEG